MKKRVASLVGVLGVALLLGGCSSVDSLTSSSSSSAKTTSSTTASASGTNNQSTSATYASLAKKTYQSGTSAAIKVNSGKSTLKASQWKKSKIDYGNLDSLNRTTTDTAYLSKANLGRSAGRTAQTWSPTGWHNQPITVNGKRVYPQNRGHLIAYTLSFNLTQDGQYKSGEDGSLDNPKNLATQTAYSNQKTMQIYEDQVRTALEQGKKVIYRVTTVFRGNELMPRGYWSQAVSTDGSVNFNVYIWNVEPGVSFDYATGRGKADSSLQVAGADKVTSSANTSASRYSSSTTTSKQVERELYKYGYKYVKKALK
ncbi:DNA/RNA non-specific endonuclease [Lactiplantibacillus fabifermentans]|uniref:DNA-entry nuclease n=2 Tax=Lactiplantibacillus fabifermentans TaxID=483011 RepID=A0A0R2NH73_9LACO|nr:DNA/RNA non-specific endonuclease [Lactiplantibacillus fabifermentans]ETY73315.1 DNA-entry nuclease [Lactiplantibacillus fabifermentans T30PCM01]KRO25145.1 DNA-entry nuclease [Lactiplantibacillus fabifermentans DSM 21115]